MKTLEIPVDKLFGPALDWAVAVAEGETAHIGRSISGRVLVYTKHYGMVINDPYKTWDWAGPIIEREEIAIEPIAHYDPRDHVTGWCAMMYYNAGEEVSFTGGTPLAAAMRCYVASKFGDTVSVPAVLVESKDGK